MENQIEVSCDYSSVVSGIKPELSLEEIAVSFALEGALLPEYVDSYISCLNLNAQMTPIDRDELLWYLMMLIKLRILLVQGERLPFHPRSTILAIPAAIYDLMCQIGIATSMEFGVTLKPELEKTLRESCLVEMNSPGFLLKLKSTSAKLMNLMQAANMGYAEELPVNRYGDVSFMCFQHGKEIAAGKEEMVIRSNTSKATPFQALMSMLLNQTHVQQILGRTVLYGTQTQFRSVVYNLPDAEHKPGGRIHGNSNSYRRGASGPDSDTGSGSKAGRGR